MSTNLREESMIQQCYTQVGGSDKGGGLPGGPVVKTPCFQCRGCGFDPWSGLSDFTFTFHFHALEKEMAIHSSTLAWRIPGTAEPGGLPSMASHRVGHD